MFIHKLKLGFYLSIMSSGILLYNCSSEHKNETKELAGGIYKGGVLRVNEVENFRTLFPININEINGFHIASQVYEGLVKFNSTDLTVQPCIAYKWEVSEDLKTYTFHLRKGIRFHDDPSFPDGKGREVTAQDFKYCFEKLCTADPSNNQFQITFKNRVVGANEFFEKKSNELTGVKVLNDSTLSIELVQPDPTFIQILCMPGCYVFPKEAYEKYGQDMRTKCVGTGPFYVETLKEGEIILMKRNPNYWAKDEHGNSLPYLDGVKWTFIKEKKSEILEFKRGNLDLIYRVPVEIFPEVMGKLEEARKRKADFAIETSPLLSTFYIGFNVQANPVFKNKDVRLAFNYAIDRDKIANFTIQGEGTAAKYGMVPYYEVFEKEGYDYKTVGGFNFDPQKAKDLLAKAGYPGGKGFPAITLHINSGGGDRNVLVADVVKKMLEENLGIKVEISVTTFPEHIENIASSKADFFRFAWVADYPDPKSFLDLFYGKHVPASLDEKTYINNFRYVNPKFDSIFEASQRIADNKERMKMLSLAEKEVMLDPPFIPIFYDENFLLEQNNVRNVPANAINYWDFSTAYLVPQEVLAKKK
ncbi:MAG: peptide ABC transporter substrate-binding protein [Bacteroidia bacterium]|nr:MAG: peptide ABC transporter substrate-binding protein [Bacteroidia bacterium]